MIHPLAHVTPPHLNTHATTSGNPGRGTQIDGVATLPRLQVMSHLAVTPYPVTILLVDDDSLERDLIYRMLTAFGYSVLEVPNAEQALVVADAHEIDLLVTDVVLPGMYGFDLAYCLGDIKVLFVTGHAEDDVVVRTGLQGTSFLSKPFRVDELQRSVRRVLHARPLAA